MITKFSTYMYFIREEIWIDFSVILMTKPGIICKHKKKKLLKYSIRMYIPDGGGVKGTTLSFLAHPNYIQSTV